MAFRLHLLGGFTLCFASKPVRGLTKGGLMLRPGYDVHSADGFGAELLSL